MSMTIVNKQYQFNTTSAIWTDPNLRCIVDFHSEKAEDGELKIRPKVGLSRYFDKICLLLVSI